MSEEHRKLIYIIVVFVTMISLTSIKSMTKPKSYITNNLYTVDSPAPINEISKGDTSKRQIILTFDGGSGSESVREILSALDKHHIKSTFFLTGKWVENNPFHVIRIHGAGHEIFSHTFNHPHLTEISDMEIRNELRSMDAILYKLLGIHSKPYFRPPYGDRDDRVLSIASSEGYQSIYWSIDAKDWMESTGETNSSVENRILESLQPGNIYLLHLGDHITGNILDDLINKIQEANYKIVSLTEGI